MAYTPTNWVDNVTPVDAARMNNIEAGISALGEGIQYENVYSPATPYQPGDVVSYGGIQYLAVNPSTGVTPPTPSGATVGYVPQDAVTVAGVRLVSTKLLPTDAQPAFRIMGDGTQEWGDGGAVAPILKLYKPVGVGALTIEGGPLRSISPSPTGQGAFWSKVAAEATDRFRMRADGFMQWGDGTALDTIMQRGGPGVVEFWESAVQVRRATSTTVINSLVGADTVSRWLVKGDGQIEWGPGGASGRDVNLYRGAADTLKTDDSLIVGNQLFINGATHAIYIEKLPTTAYAAMLVRTVADSAAYRFRIEGSGRLLWGDGAAAEDTNLYRGGANVLQTDDAFKSVSDLLAGQDVYSRQGGTGQIILSQVGVLPCIYLGSALTQRIQVCTGTPEGVITASVGSLALRTDGGASTTLYVKQSGAGNTGWVAK